MGKLYLLMGKSATGKDTLYQRISANGSYDTATPGTYTIEYFVTDSSGNTSDPQIFTLKVQ